MVSILGFPEDPMENSLLQPPFPAPSSPHQVPCDVQYHWYTIVHDTIESPREVQQMPDDKEQEDRLFGLSSFLGSPGEDPLEDFVEEIFGDPDSPPEDDGDPEQTDEE